MGIKTKIGLIASTLMLIALQEPVSAGFFANKFGALRSACTRIARSNPLAIRGTLMAAAVVGGSAGIATQAPVTLAIHEMLASPAHRKTVVVPPFTKKTDGQEIVLPGFTVEIATFDYIHRCKNSRGETETEKNLCVSSAAVPVKVVSLATVKDVDHQDDYDVVEYPTEMQLDKRHTQRLVETLNEDGRFPRNRFGIMEHGYNLYRINPLWRDREYLLDAGANLWTLKAMQAFMQDNGICFRSGTGVALQPQRTFEGSAVAREMASSPTIRKNVTFVERGIPFSAIDKAVEVTRIDLQDNQESDKLAE